MNELEKVKAFVQKLIESKPEKKHTKMLLSWIIVSMEAIWKLCYTFNISNEIYRKLPDTFKDFDPRNALHYEKTITDLLKRIRSILDEKEE